MYATYFCHDRILNNFCIIPYLKGKMFLQRINGPSGKREWHYVDDAEDLRNEIARYFNSLICFFFQGIL